MKIGNKFFMFIGLLSGIFALGTFGFHYLEGWELFDSLYATVITMATVGYGDFAPVTHSGRAFAILLILVGLGVLSYSALEITSFIVEGHFNRYLMKRRVDQLVKNMKGHFIVCGFGRTGHHIVEELLKNKAPMVVIEKDAAMLDTPLLRKIPHVIGDATNDDVLHQAGIKTAVGLAATLQTDEMNLFLVLSAKTLNPRLRCVAKALYDSSQKKMKMAGADSVILPNFIGGMRIASELLRPNIVSFLDTMLRNTTNVRVEEASIPEKSSADGKTLKELGLYEKFGLNCVAIREKGEAFHYNPAPGHKVHAGDTIVVFADPDRLKRLRDFLRN
jgi:voltage-gated potassium channel